MNNNSSCCGRRGPGPTGNPFVVNIEQTTKCNRTFRTVLWTGEHLQLAVMCIGAGEDIGAEQHLEHDQFIRIEQGCGILCTGDAQCRMNDRIRVSEGCAIVIPAGLWHNLINTGSVPMKVYSLYGPPQHRPCTVHRTKADAQADEGDQA